MRRLYHTKNNMIEGENVFYLFIFKRNELHFFFFLIQMSTLASAINDKKKNNHECPVNLYSSRSNYKT